MNFFDKFKKKVYVIAHLNTRFWFFRQILLTARPIAATVQNAKYMFLAMKFSHRLCIECVITVFVQCVHKTKAFINLI